MLIWLAVDFLFWKMPKLANVEHLETHKPSNHRPFIQWKHLGAELASQGLTPRTMQSIITEQQSRKPARAQQTEVCNAIRVAWLTATEASLAFCFVGVFLLPLYST